MDQNAWANALDQFWGNVGTPGSPALLMLERSLLPNIAELSDGQFERVEDAENDFLRVVNVYLRGKANRPWYPEPFYADRPPLFLLQIAVQVYAASKMADALDRSHTIAAYYAQLENLVGDFGAKERFNLNDQGENHQMLWRDRLAEWARHKGLVLKLPEDHDFAGRHVQLPKSQVVLRVGDLERLPIFFHKCLFKPADCDEPNRMETQVEIISDRLQQRKNDFDCFSSWAQRVLDDRPKFPIAVAQVERALRDWDGRLVLRNAGRRAQRKTEKNRWVWLDVRVAQRRLRAVGGVSSATAKALTPADIEMLFAGKETTAGDLLEFHDGLTLFVYEPEDAAFKQADYVDAGKKGILLSGPGHFANWNRLLNCDGVASIEGRFSGEDEDAWEWLAGLPAGCRALLFQINDRLRAAELISDAWRPFLRLPPARVSLSGGLRIGRGEHFVAGAGPQLTISGNHPPTFIYVDGEQVRISGRMVQLDQFSHVGEHEIVARYDGKIIPPKRFTVARPENVVPTTLPSRGWTFHEGRWPVWGATFSADDENEAGPNDHATRLFGVRGSNLKMIEPSSTESSNDRLTAIALLSGMPSAKDPDVPSEHFLVRQLMMMQPVTSLI